MNFSYACFISYRAGDRLRDNPYIVKLLSGLRDHLTSELGLLLEEEVSDVFVDWRRLQGGDFFNAKLAQALCRSVCMIVVFTPTYFSLSHSYCAREYRAMERLEARRLALLKRRADRQHGLIIPVVLRYKNKLPKSIRETRQYYNFEDVLQDDNSVIKPAGYFTTIKEIAGYIAERYWELSALPEPAGSDCNGFAFPSDKEIKSWLLKLTGPSIGGAAPTARKASRRPADGRQRGK